MNRRSLHDYRRTLYRVRTLSEGATRPPLPLDRYSITGWSKTDIDNMYFKEVGLDKIIAQTKEARMAGVPQCDLVAHLCAKSGQGETCDTHTDPNLSFWLLPTHQVATYPDEYYRLLDAAIQTQTQPA